MSASETNMLLGLYPDLAQRSDDNDLVIAESQSKCSQNKFKIPMLNSNHISQTTFPAIQHLNLSQDIPTKEIKITKLKMKRLTSERKKEQREGAQLLFPVTVPVFLTLLQELSVKQY